MDKFRVLFVIFKDRPERVLAETNKSPLRPFKLVTT
jgi:hypothetical protein